MLVGKLRSNCSVLAKILLCSFSIMLISRRNSVLSRRYDLPNSASFPASTATNGQSVKDARTSVYWRAIVVAAKVGRAESKTMDIDLVSTAMIVRGEKVVR